MYGSTVWLVRERAVYAACLRTLGHAQRSCGRNAGITDEFIGDDGQHIVVVGWFNGRRGTLAHEFSHVAFAVLHRVGIPVENGQPNEAFCYLVGWLIDEFDELTKAKQYE